MRCNASSKVLSITGSLLKKDIVSEMRQEKGSRYVRVWRIGDCD